MPVISILISALWTLLFMRVLGLRSTLSTPTLGTYLWRIGLPPLAEAMSERQVYRVVMKVALLRASLTPSALLPLFLVLICVYAPRHARAQDKPPDLSGLWIMEAESGAPNVPNVRMFQDGTKIKSVFVDGLDLSGATVGIWLA